MTSPTVVWSVHVLMPYALIKDINKERDDLDNDNSYFATALLNGESVVTEWNPELRLNIILAIDAIPHVYRQQCHYIGLESVDQVLDEIIAFEKDHDFEGHPINTHPKTIKSSKSKQLRPFDDNENILIKTVVLNFTDGMEVDGWPGISVIQGLEKRCLAFTGANSKLYYLDSDKALIKRHLVESGTPTPGYCDVYSGQQMEARAQTQAKAETEPELKSIDEEEMANKPIILDKLLKLKFPLLVKPAISSSSRGISIKSVVDTPEEAYERAMEIKKIWGPVYVEEYITGREYTVLVSGSQETGIRVYKVLERIFRAELPERERMLTYDMKWGNDNYGSDETVETASWWMQVCSDPDQERLQPQAMSMYASFGGNGYCRMDLREDYRTGEVFVVDVNANCAIEDDNDCAMGKILKASGLNLGQFFSILMEDAICMRDNLLSKEDAYPELKSLAAIAMTGNIKHALETTTNEQLRKAVRVSA